jgi:HK97 family phage portal protein
MAKSKKKPSKKLKRADVVQVHLPPEVGYEPTPAGFQSFNVSTLLPSWSWVNDPSMITGAADALSITALWRAITLVGGILGSMPLHVYRGDTERLEEPRLIEKPEQDWDRSATLMRMVHDLFVYGEVYAITDTNLTVDGRVDQILVLNAGEIDVRRVNGRLRYKYQGSDLPPDEVERTVWMTKPGHDRGIGLLETFGDRGLAMSRTIQEYAKSTFSDSAVPSIVIKTDDPDQTFAEASELKAGWMQQFRGKREPAVLNGAEIESLAFSPEAAQLDLMWSQATKDVSLMTGIPARYFNLEVSSMTYSTIESERRDLIDLGVMPFATRIERFFSDLLPRGQKARWVFDSFLRGSTKERYETYEINARIANMDPDGRGILSHEEVRELEHRDPLPKQKPKPAPTPEQLTLVPDPADEEAS